MSNRSEASQDGVTPAPDSTAVRTALWRAMHVEHDAAPHVFTDELGLALVGPEDDGWRARHDMHPQWTRTFRAAMVARARGIFADGPPPPEVAATLGVDLREITGDGLLWLRRFEPFGPRNEAPLFYAENVPLYGMPRTVGEKHLKFAVQPEGANAPLDAIAFNLGHMMETLERRDRLDKLVFHPEWNIFRGQKKIQLRVVALE